MNSIQVLILKRFKNVTQVKENIVTIVLYSILFSFIVFVIVKYIPQLANQTKSLIDRFSEFKFSGNSNSIIQKYIVDMLGQIDIKSYIKSGFNVSLQLASEIGKWSVNIFI
ncbi:MAG: AI-2E family transporter, partial [Clostridium tyrobutyricum]|nr:AI-2E family transporter [Clostridium tyrobutyricum]